MIIEIQQPVGKLPGIWITGFTQKQKDEIKHFIVARKRRDHPDFEKVNRCGPFFQIDGNDVFFIELWIHGGVSESIQDEWRQELLRMIKEQFDVHHEWSSCAWCGDKNAEHIDGKCQTCVKRDKDWIL